MSVLKIEAFRKQPKAYLNGDLLDIEGSAVMVLLCYLVFYRQVDINDIEEVFWPEKQSNFDNEFKKLTKALGTASDGQPHIDRQGDDVFLHSSLIAFTNAHEVLKFCSLSNLKIIKESYKGNFLPKAYRGMPTSVSAWRDSIQQTLIDAIWLSFFQHCEIDQPEQGEKFLNEAYIVTNSLPFNPLLDPLDNHTDQTLLRHLFLLLKHYNIHEGKLVREVKKLVDEEGEPETVEIWQEVEVLSQEDCVVVLQTFDGENELTSLLAEFDLDWDWVSTSTVTEGNQANKTKVESAVFGKSNEHNNRRQDVYVTQSTGVQIGNNNTLVSGNNNIILNNSRPEPKIEDTFTKDEEVEKET